MPVSNLDCSSWIRDGLEGEPWMSLHWLLAPVPVVIQELLAGVDGMLCHEDEPGHLLDHDDLSDAVGAHSTVIQEAPVPPRLASCVNTE